MLIKVDAREGPLLSRCRALVGHYGYDDQLTVVSEQLPVGDVALYSGDRLVLILERKSLSDLAASISDGRYSEQSFRLNESSVPNHDIVYLIEGNLERFVPKWGKVDKTALYSSIASIMCFKGFSILRSNGTDESSEYIIRLARKLDKGGVDNMYSNAGSGSLKGYNEVLKTKKDCLTPANIHSVWLSQIPEVSARTAQRLLQEFGTVWNIRQSIIENPDALVGIKTETSSGKPRAISKRTVESLKKYLS